MHRRVAREPFSQGFPGRGNHTAPGGANIGHPGLQPHGFGNLSKHPFHRENRNGNQNAVGIRHSVGHFCRCSVSNPEAHRFFCGTHGNITGRDGVNDTGLLKSPGGRSPD